MQNYFDFLLKNPSALVLLLAGVAGSVASYIASQKDAKQQDNIESLSQQNTVLTASVKELQELNIDLTKQFGSITDANLALSQETQQLISEVRSLTEQSKTIISDVKNLSDYDAKENLMSGKIRLRLDELSPDAIIKFEAGDLKVTSTVAKFNDYYEGAREPYTELPFGLFQNGNMAINMHIYDLDDNLIAEIEDNNWRRYPNSSAAFNYDAEGFEVLDNKGNVAMNFNVQDNHIVVHGIFFRSIDRPGSTPEYRCHILGDETNEQYRFNKNSGIFKVERNGHHVQERPSTYDNFIELMKKRSRDIGIKRLFKYSGDNWLNKRAGPN